MSDSEGSARSRRGRGGKRRRQGGGGGGNAGKGSGQQENAGDGTARKGIGRGGRRRGNAGGRGRGKGGAGRGNAGKGGAGTGNARKGGANKGNAGKGGGAGEGTIARGSGAALGEKVLRLSSIHTVGLFINHALTLIGAIVVAIFLGPADFGTYGLLLFAASMLSFLFNLGSKQGTLKRVFGGGDDDDEDDDEEEEEEELAESRQRALGTGLILTVLVSIAGTLLFFLFSDAIAGFLLKGSSDRDLILWAGLAGGFGAVLRLGSIALWMEHRPIPYVAIESLRPALTLAIAVPLLAAGAGVTAAIAGYAIGSAVSALAAVFLLRRSVELAFEPREAVTIMRRGATRVPIVSSMWIVGYMDIFLLSRFVNATDLGVYHLASKAGFAVAFLPAGYRKALRPLRKTPSFHAVEAEYGPGTARGVQLGYFLLMLVGVLLAITLFARTLSRISPEGYGPAAHLIPLLSAGLVAPTVYRMLNKTAKFKNKSRLFIGGAVVAAALFIGICLLLIPELGIWAPPIAMLSAFAVPSVVIMAKGQRGRTPAELPAKSFALASGVAIAIGLAYYLFDPPGVFLEVLLPVLGLILWAVLMPVVGAVPKEHRQPIKEMVRGLIGRGDRRIDELAVIESMNARELRAARMAIPGGKSLEHVAAKLEREEDEVAELLVRALRRFAAAAGMGSARRTDRDAAIGRFLFARATPADRSALGKDLMKSGQVDPGDLRELEAIAAELRATPLAEWRR